MFNRTEKIACGAEGIIYYKRNIMFFCYFSYCIKIRNIESGIPDCFKINGFGFLINQFFEIGRFVSINKFHCYTYAFELDLKLIISSSI